MRNLRMAVCLLAAMPWIGCVGKAPICGPETTPPEQANETQRKDTLSHLVGSWELPGKGGKVKEMIFEPGGRLTFREGLEYFNPGTWQLDTDRQELVITLPQTPNDKLDIFHLYVGQGVKAFDRARKEITYHFDQETWELNVAGWTYSKPDKPAAQPEAEPVLK
jgi:hypothetical protein